MTSNPQQQIYSVSGASNQATMMPVMYVPANIVPAPGFAAWPGSAVPQFAVMPVQQVVPSADTRQISLPDFRNEVGKKLHFCVTYHQT